MNIQEEENKFLQITSITREQEHLVSVYITIPLVLDNSTHQAALQYVYKEALSAGCAEYDRLHFLDAITILGASLEVSVSSEGITFTILCLDTVLQKILLLLKKMLLHPLFKKSEIDRIKKYLEDVFLHEKENARAVAYQQFIGQLTKETDPRHIFPANTLLHELRKITTTHLFNFHAILWTKQWVCTYGCSLSSGEKIRKFLHNIHKSTAGVGVREDESVSEVICIDKREVILSDIPNKQNIEINIGNSISIRTDTHAYPAFVLGMSVLGLPGGFTGRLMSIVREKKGLTYSIYAYVDAVTKKRDGFWRITTFFHPKDIVSGLKATLEEITKMHRHGLSEDELLRFKNILHTRYTLINDSLLKKVSELHSLKNKQMSNIEFQEFKKNLQNISTDEVHEAMCTYLNPHSLIISGAGPTDEKRNAIIECIK